MGLESIKKISPENKCVKNTYFFEEMQKSFSNWCVSPYQWLASCAPQFFIYTQCKRTIIQLYFISK